MVGLQLRLIEICERVFVRMLEGSLKMEEAGRRVDELEGEEEVERHRRLLRPYLK